MKQISHFINGEFVAGREGRRFDKRSPLDNRVIASVSEAGRDEVNAAVAAARAALEGPWGRMTVTERTELLYAVANEINRRFDDFVAAEVADTGKPVSLASHLDIPRGAANAVWARDYVTAARAAGNTPRCQSRKAPLHMRLRSSRMR